MERPMTNPWYVSPEQLDMQLTEEELAELIKRGPRVLASEVTPEQVGIYHAPRKVENDE